MGRVGEEEDRWWGLVEGTRPCGGCAMAYGRYSGEEDFDWEIMLEVSRVEM